LFFTCACLDAVFLDVPEDTSRQGLPLPGAHTSHLCTLSKILHHPEHFVPGPRPFGLSEPRTIHDFFGPSTPSVVTILIVECRGSAAHDGARFFPAWSAPVSPRRTRAFIPT